MSDSETTVAELRQRVAAFVAERDWEQFHTPENLSQAIAIEASELMEQFLWRTREESGSLVRQEEGREAIVSELADVVIYVLSMANALRVDVSRAVLRKLEENHARFPADSWRGRAR